jgi:hypothetical protein
MSDLTMGLVAVFNALIATSFLIGAGWYDQAILDTASPSNPAIVRQVEGGANRKLFWIPANIPGDATLLATLWASWPGPAGRAASLVAVGFLC